MELDDAQIKLLETAKDLGWTNLDFKKDSLSHQVELWGVPPNPTYLSSWATGVHEPIRFQPALEEAK